MAENLILPIYDSRITLNVTHIGLVEQAASAEKKFFARGEGGSKFSFLAEGTGSQIVYEAINKDIGLDHPKMIFSVSETPAEIAILVNGVLASNIPLTVTAINKTDLTTPETKYFYCLNSGKTRFQYRANTGTQTGETEILYFDGFAEQLFYVDETTSEIDALIEVS